MKGNGVLCTPHHITCAQCSTVFPDYNSRSEHVHNSPNHPRCEKCDKGFANALSLKVHYTLSPNHIFCEVCDQHFESPAGQKVHFDTCAHHLKRGVEPLDLHHLGIDQSMAGWEDIAGAILFPEINDLAKECDTAEHYTSQDEYWLEDGLEYCNDNPVEIKEANLQDLEDTSSLEAPSSFEGSTPEMVDYSSLSDINTDDIPESVWDYVDRQVSYQFRQAILRDTIQTPNGGLLVVTTDPMLDLTPEEIQNLSRVYVGSLPMDPVMEEKLKQDEIERQQIEKERESLEHTPSES